MSINTSIRVLHLGAGKYVGGDTSHSTFAIWNELSRDVTNYTVIGRSKNGKYYRHKYDKKIEIILLPSYIRSEAEFLITQYKALKIAKEIKPTIVISQCPVLGGLVAKDIKYRFDSKLLFEFHMGHYFKNKSIFSKDFVLEYLTRKNIVHADRIRVLSQGMKKELINKYGSKHYDKIEILPPRVDLNKFNIVKDSWVISEIPTLVIVGSVNNRKGQYRLINIIIRNNIKVRLWIIGVGDELDKCKKLVKSHNLEDQFTFYGHMNHQQLSKLLPRADAMILFSNMEGTPRVIMEGMAVGLPIITTNAGYCKDIVEHNVEGFILGNDVEYELIKYLNILFSKEELRIKMGHAAMNRAHSEFNSNIVYKQYREIIRKTISE